MVPVKHEHHPRDTHEQVPVPGREDVSADAGIVHLLGALNRGGATTHGSCQGNRLCDLASCQCRLAHVVVNRHDAPAAHRVLTSLAAEISDPLARRFLTGEMHELYGTALPVCTADYGYDTATGQVFLAHRVATWPGAQPAAESPVCALRLPLADAYRLDMAAGGTAPQPPTGKLRGRLDPLPLPTVERWFPLGAKTRDGVTCVATTQSARLMSDPEHGADLYALISDAAQRSGMLSPELVTFLGMCDSLPRFLDPKGAGVSVDAYIAGKDTGDWKMSHRAYVSSRPTIHVEIGASPDFNPELTDPNANYAGRLFGR